MNVARVIARYGVNVRWQVAGSSDVTPVTVTVFASHMPNKGFDADVNGVRDDDREEALERALQKMVAVLFPDQRAEIARPSRVAKVEGLVPAKPDKKPVAQGTAKSVKTPAKKVVK